MNWYFYVDTILLGLSILIVVWMVTHRPRAYDLHWAMRLLSASLYAAAQLTWTYNYLLDPVKGLMASKTVWVLFNIVVVMQLAVYTWRQKK